MEWWVWITRWFLFCIRNSRLYWTCHLKAQHIPNNACFSWLHWYNNGSVFKIKDGFKLELQTTEMIQQFGSRRKLIDTTKNGEKVVDVLLLQ